MHRRSSQWYGTAHNLGWHAPSSMGRSHAPHWSCAIQHPLDRGIQCSPLKIQRQHGLAMSSWHSRSGDSCNNRCPPDRIARGYLQCGNPYRSSYRAHQQVRIRSAHADPVRCARSNPRMCDSERNHCQRLRHERQYGRPHRPWVLHRRPE